MLHTLPIIAVLRTRDGIVFRYIDGSQSRPIELQSIPQSTLCECERGMIKLACNSTGWITERYYYKMAQMV